MTCDVAVAVTAAIGTAGKSDLRLAKAEYAGLQVTFSDLQSDVAEHISLQLQQGAWRNCGTLCVSGAGATQQPVCVKRMKLHHNLLCKSVETIELDYQATERRLAGLGFSQSLT